MAGRDRAGSRHRAQGVADTWPPRGAAPDAIALPSPPRAWSHLLERLRAWARAEAGAGRLLPWVPVAFGAGIALCFTAPREPVLIVTIIAAMACSAVASRARRDRFFVAAVMLAAVACGFAIATWKTARVAHTV